MNDSLTRLGDAIENAAATDLSSRRPHRRRLSPRVITAAGVLAVAIPGVAIATTVLTGTDEVARSMPAGTLSLAGTNPTCTLVRQDVEYHCALAKAPAPEVSDWKGTVEPTVDRSKHVNGGCRSLRSDGREWECYTGQTAVAQKIIGPDFLGEFAPSPGQG